MKIESIKNWHIESATRQIDEQGIPKNHVWSQYYVLVGTKEYPFKYLVSIAYEKATGNKLQFQSNDTYRSYIEGLGFKTNYYECGYNFFTKEELEYYSSIVNTDYRKSNPNHKYYGQKLLPIIAKAKYWAGQLLIDGYELRQDGNWLNGHVARIKSYFWPRIFKGEDKDVFFNVEVNGYNRFLGYKLDGYYETTKALPEDKIKILNDYKKLINWEWPQIPFEKLSEYNWDRLLSESKEYVNQYQKHHDHLKKLLSKESKIARIAWNTNGWVKPSGRIGKSTNPTFESEHGFGHEEWLFDGDKLINGYKYGFLEPIHKHRSKYEGKVFDLSLYTKDAESNNSYWVANLKNVEVINPSESEKVLGIYKREGWYNSMKNDLHNLGIDPDVLDKWVSSSAEQLFNIKFEASQVAEIRNSLIPILNDNTIPTNRYTLLNITSKAQQRIDEEKKSGFSFDDSGSENAELSYKSKRKARHRELELELKHNLIQTKFLKYLQNQHGKKIVKRECKAYGASRIDIAQKTDTGFIFYEIKTYNNIQTSIRESIGQLLEYCLFPNVNEAEKIVLVSHIPPSDEIKGYLNHIKNYINIPFSYIHFDTEKEEVISEI